MEPETENPATANTTTTEPEGSERLGTQADVEVLGPCKRRIRARVPANSVNERLDANYRELALTVTLPGFRRGRVPRKLLEKRFGDDVREEVRESLLEDSFEEIRDEHKLRVFGRPRFDNVRFEEDSELRYDVELNVEPEFEVPDWHDIEVRVEPTPVDDSDVDKEIEAMRTERSTLQPADLPEGAGGIDPSWFLIGSYELFADGEKVKSKDDVWLQPSTGVVDSIPIEGLADSLNSWNRGEGPFTQTVTLPETYSDEVLRGRTVELRLQVNHAHKVEPPSIEDLAEGFGFDSVEAFREATRERLIQNRIFEAQREAERKLLDELIGRVEMELPEDVLERSRASSGHAHDHDHDHHDHDHDHHDHDHDHEHSHTHSEEAEAEDSEEAGEELGTGRAEDSETLRRNLKEFFLLERIAEKEKIFATEDEIRRRVIQLSFATGANPSDLIEELNASGRMAALRTEVRHEKVRAFLRETARVIQPEAEGSESAEETRDASADAESSTPNEGETPPSS